MLRRKSSNRLQLNDDLLMANEVGDIDLAKRLSLVAQLKRLSGLEGHTPLLQFDL